MADLSGRSVGRYHILEPLGQGGMATVYKAFDTRLEREVAIKFIRMELVNEAQKEEVLKRFEREAKALARLAHPNIVQVHDYGEYEGAPYLVMVYLTGGTLKSRIGQPMPWVEAVRWLIPVAEALHYAHQRGIIHRDIKPSNILVTDTGKPMLSDFGIAKILDTGDALSLTPTGVGIGTPEYMSPEQGLGRMVDYRTDIYALGVVLYELVTGKKPYTADTPMAVVMKHISNPLPRPRDSVPDLPEALEHIIFTAMAKEAGERYKDMREMEKALEAVSSQPVSLNDRGKGNAAAETKIRVYGKHELASSPFPKKVRGERGGLSFPKAGARVGDEGKRRPWLLAALVLVCLMAVVGVGIATGGFSFFRTTTPIATTMVAMVKSMTPTPTRRSGTTTIPSYTFTPSKTATLTYTFTPSNTVTRTNTPTPTLGIGSTMISEIDGMVLVYVPEGEFLMGAANSDTNASNDEKPQHTIWLDAFWIDRTEVTNALYQKCVKAGACTEPSRNTSPSRNSYYGNPDYDNYPVIYVDWNQASIYCTWAGRRLPSEAEWEKAARGTDGRTYPWGNEAPNIHLLNRFYAAEVGSTPLGASPYGALDMAGNVWEWVNDWYQDNYYQNSPAKNPTGPASGTSRVLRSGYWDRDNTDVRVTQRSRIIPDYSFYSYGFRCVVSP